VVISYLAVMTNCGLLMISTYDMEDDSKMSALKVMLDTFGETSSFERFAILMVTERVIACVMYLISLMNPVSERMQQEQYRQEYYENREAVIHRMDQEDSVHVAAVRRRARRDFNGKTMNFQDTKIDLDTPIQFEGKAMNFKCKTML